MKSDMQWIKLTQVSVKICARNDWGSSLGGGIDKISFHYHVQLGPQRPQGLFPRE